MGFSEFKQDLLNSCGNDKELYSKIKQAKDLSEIKRVFKDKKREEKFSSFIYVSLFLAVIIVIVVFNEYQCRDVLASAVFVIGYVICEKILKNRKNK